MIDLTSRESLEYIKRIDKNINGKSYYSKKLIVLTKNDLIDKIVISSEEVVSKERKKSLSKIRKNLKVIYVMLLGDSMAGKLSLYKRYFYDTFDHLSYGTFGITDDSKLAQVGDSVFTLKIWAINS